ncbi:MAG: hypothetical protein MUF39_12590 [Cyclobacteriaceae bacterium]|jgi:uncharacterized tellurite resistance protein B-like protein|nr:hypothetical protein [Cyclobacteriaceae bacterium]
MIILEQLKMLVNLAMIDGSMAEREKTFIKKIGMAHGFPESSVETLFYNQHELIMPDKLTADQKFNFALSLFQLMKLDEKLYQPEIKFCGSMMEKLGYKKEVVGEFMLSAKSEVMTPEEIDSLKKITASYLITN